MFIRNNQKKLWVLVLAIFLIAVFFSTYRLAESPPVWYDEGIFSQVAINMALGDGYNLRVAPSILVPAEVSTTGLTVTFPVSLIVKYFGVNVVNLRVMMVIFILATVIISFFFLRNLGRSRVALYGMMLLVSFAPLYGHGKSVLGEVPGTFFFLVFLYMLHRLEQSDSPPKILYILAGLSAGLCVITKPFFLILIPILLVIGVVFRKVVLPSRASWFMFGVAFVVPLFVWLFIQFFGPNTINVFAHYSNPNSIDTWQAVRQNIWSFFSELQPGYYLVLLMAWVSSFLLRMRNGERPSIAEWLAISFSILTLIVYLRTSGYYRYFFPGQMLALVFFPYALFTIVIILSKQWARAKRWLGYGAHIILIGLFAFQFYQTIFHSYISDYFSSTSSAQLERYFEDHDSTKSIFLYDVPEVAIFMPESVPYYQYLEISEDILVGEDQLGQIRAGLPDAIIMGELFWSEHQDEDQFDYYRPVSTTLPRYVVLKKVNNEL
jgi:4-amino-4-deoxy-L-arabinose transferase-like glycosyltransferase